MGWAQTWPRPTCGHPYHCFCGSNLNSYSTQDPDLTCNLSCQISTVGLYILLFSVEDQWWFPTIIHQLLFVFVVLDIYRWLLLGGFQNILASLGKSSTSQSVSAYPGGFQIMEVACWSLQWLLLDLLVVSSGPRVFFSQWFLVVIARVVGYQRSGHQHVLEPPVLVVG